MSAGGIFHGGGVDAASRRFGRPVEEWLDLSTGINPCPPSLPDVPAEVWQRLPDERLLTKARHCAANYYGSDDVLPIAGAGTQPLIRALAGLGDRSRRVAILSPTYGEYAYVFGQAGYTVDALASVAEISDRHGVVVIVNPNNPDGRILARAELLRLAEQLERHGTMLIVDEAFGDLTPELSLANALARLPYLIVLRSFGKFFGYAGIRLSFAIAGRAYADELEVALGPWPVSGPALSLGSALMESDTAALRQTIRARRAALDDVLNEAGLSIAGGTDLFALVQTPKASSIFQGLAEQAILVRAFDYRPDWLRIGLFADDAEGERFAAALKAIS